MGGSEMNPLFQQQWQNFLCVRPDCRALESAISEAFTACYNSRHGHFDRWLSTVESLAAELPSTFATQLDADAVRASHDNEAAYKKNIESALTALMPWRKGPFELCGVDLDCEWRSDWKYQRLLDAGLDVEGKTVLDVGTGNGYFLYRLLGSGARFAFGLDPSWHYFAQFLLLQQFMKNPNVAFLPLTLDEAPLKQFDCTLSMGVLYHRRDPLAFLAQLRDTIVSGGQLVIETLVVEGDEQTVYMPEKRYAGMHNVWFLPSTVALSKWLRRLGLNIEYIGEPVITTVEEQRQTRWMQSHSLAQFLQIDNNMRPPQRAIVIASKV